MNTKELINALAADTITPSPMWNFKATMILLVGIAISTLIFLIFLGPRLDIATAAFDPHVIFKFIFSGSVIIIASIFASALLRPSQDPKLNWSWLALPILTMIFGMIGQMITSPFDFWWQGMIGRYPEACLRNIPILAIAPLICLMIVGRHGAPTNPTRAGLTIGAISGGIGAFIYALHCPDDSALFVVVWYSLAIFIMSTIGFFVGARVLRW